MNILHILQDVKLTATNDDQYFVFEDFLYQVRVSGFCFSFSLTMRIKLGDIRLVDGSLILKQISVINLESKKFSFSPLLHCLKNQLFFACVLHYLFLY